MSEQYLGQNADEARRALGEGLLAHLAARDVIDPLPPAPAQVAEDPSEETPKPSFRQQIAHMEGERKQSLVQLFMSSMASSMASAGRPEQDAPKSSFGVAAAERERERARG
jgi:hypothetical protein